MGALLVKANAIMLVFLTTLVPVCADGQTLYSFDSAEDFLAPAAVWPAWRETLVRHETEREEIHRCVLDIEACAGRIKGLRLVLIKGRGLTLEQQIRLVNRYINLQQYKDDRVSVASEAGNQWMTLLEFLHNGGDCEDFAAAKYFVLRELGVDAEDMRIVIGREPKRTTHHAMLAVRLDEGVWLLENDNTIHRNGYQDINNFVYAINEQGIWDHEK